MQLASLYLFYYWQTDTGFKKWQKSMRVKNVV
jgi:hypothetical protein